MNELSHKKATDVIYVKIASVAFFVAMSGIEPGSQP